jgi:hypothetical protein
MLIFVGASLQASPVLRPSRRHVHRAPNVDFSICIAANLIYA